MMIVYKHRFKKLNMIMAVVNLLIDPEFYTSLFSDDFRVCRMEIPPIMLDIPDDKHK